MVVVEINILALMDRYGCRFDKLKFKGFQHPIPSYSKTV